MPKQSRTAKPSKLHREAVESIRSMMEQTGTSTASLAESLDMSRAYVYKSLDEGSNLTMAQAERFANALGYSFDLTPSPLPTHELGEPGRIRLRENRELL